MNILDILKRYTDENHRLSQKEIQDILEREYDMTVERKAVKRNLMNLIEFGYNINYSESVRIFKDKDGKEQENVILSDFYLEREFTDSELRLLIDSVLFSNHIPYKQDKELVDKLASLSNIYFKKRVNHIARMPEDKTDNKQLFYNVELLDEAIDKKHIIEKGNLRISQTLTFAVINYMYFRCTDNMGNEYQGHIEMDNYNIFLELELVSGSDTNNLACNGRMIMV